MSAPSRPDAQGLVLAPFRALRYAAGNELAALTSPPYDVVSDAERNRLAAGNAHNVVELILPRSPNGHAADAYRRAGVLLREWQEQGVLQLDEAPALYVYEERVPDAGSGEHVQRGLLGAVGLRAPDAGVILPHENTMAGPVADRLALIEATEANLEPIFLVYDGGGAASAAVAGADSAEPTAATVTDDGVRHRLWALTDPGLLAAVAADLGPRRAVIADGHHRYATYLQYQAERAADGHGPWDFGLALLVDATAFGPQVHPIHRAVPMLPLATAVQRAAAGFRVTPLAGGLAAAGPALAEAASDGAAFVLADGSGSELYLLTGPDPDGSAAAFPGGRSRAWRDLDVAVAHYYLIRTLWGLPDDEETVLFAHDVPDALRAAGAGTALLLNPTPVTQVVAVAAEGERMPRKSTLFTPKPRSGMVFRLLQD